MHQTSRRCGMALAAVALLPMLALADPVNQVAPGTLGVPVSSNFEDVPTGGGSGTNYDGIVTSGTGMFAERFLGQTLTESPANFDMLSGAPSNPLTLQIGAASQNLSTLQFGTNILTGLGPLGFPSGDAIGEGSIALLFPSPQFELGFDIVGTNVGSATVNFFRADGSLIHTIVLSGLADGSFAFRREGNVTDIAGISVHNDDPAGVGYDNFRFNPQQQEVVPEPASVLLLAAGAFGLVATRRFRRQAV